MGEGTSSSRVAKQKTKKTHSLINVRALRTRRAGRARGCRGVQYPHFLRMNLVWLGLFGILLLSGQGAVRIHVLILSTIYTFNENLALLESKHER